MLDASSERCYYDLMTTTTTHTIRCAHCRGTHATPAEVRACAQVPLNPVETKLAESVDLIAAFSKASAVSEPAPTEKQLAFLQKLLAERPSYVVRAFPTTRRDCSYLIDTLLALPREKAESTRGASVNDLLADVADGYYALPSKTGANDLDFVVVTTSKGTVNPEAKGKRYVNRYLGGQGPIRISYAEQRVFAQLLFELSPDQRQFHRTLFGIELGRCCRCGRTLTDETSRALGLGPECRSKL